MTEAQLRTMIDRLTTALGSGILRVKDSDGKERWFTSTNEMISARKALQNDLRTLTGACRQRRALNIHNRGVR